VAGTKEGSTKFLSKVIRMLSSSSKYAIRAVTYIACQPRNNGKIGIKKISEDLDLPTPFLAKILQLLARQKILSSSKGPHGGFSLLRDSKKITLLDIITTIDGNDIFDNCVIHNMPCKCVDESKLKCTIHDDYFKVRNGLVKLFASKTVYSLVKSATKQETISI
jgi:Rrf2 family transcriptional regulator, iron-sulfur cluster assembly transcription factor